MCSALQVGLDRMMVGGVEVLNLPLAGDGEWAEAAVAQGNENAEDLRRRFFVCKTHYPFRESMSWRSLTVALVRQGQTVRYAQSCLQIMYSTKFCENLHGKCRWNVYVSEMCVHAA